MRLALLLHAALFTLAACGDDDGSASTDGGGRDASADAGTADGGDAPDAGDVDAATIDAGDGDAGGEPDAGGSTCGTARPDVSSVSGTEGLVIARDGTIYYSQRRAVGRLLPDGTQDDGWAMLPPGAMTVWGLALTADNATLYAASPTTSTLYAIATATAAVTPLLTGAGSPNGMTMGADGEVYYSDFAGGRVYRVDSAGARNEVTASPIATPNGVAFGPDGRLYVESYSTGTLFALTLSDGAESARDTIASSLGSPDGLAFDEDGRIYVGDNGGGRLIRLEADGTGPMVLRMGIGAAANVEFGAGPLTCSDIYVASSGDLARYEMGTAAGAAVPWH